MEEIRDSNGRFIEGMKRSEESKKKQSDTLKKNYDDGKRKPWQLGQTKETNPSLAQAAAKMKERTPPNKGKKVSDDPKMAEAHRRAVETRKARGGYAQPEERRQRTSATMKAQPEKYRENRKKQNPPRQKGTDIEQRMWVALDAWHVPYEKNPILIGASGHPYDRDILVGGWLNVECDGGYHTATLNPTQPERDARSDGDLTKAGYVIMRLSKKEINRNADALAIQIRNQWLSKYEPSVVYRPEENKTDEITKEQISDPK